MSPRPAPRIRVDEIVARVWLEPSGRHCLEVAVPSGVVAMRFSADQVAQLEKAIAGFKREVTFEDGRPGESFHSKQVTIEVS